MDAQTEIISVKFDKINIIRSANQYYDVYVYDLGVSLEQKMIQRGFF